MTKPLRTVIDDDGTVTIIDAQGWHIATMENMSGEGERQALALCQAFNGSAEIE